jgi:radical SAM protein with 4Fe4S-binding SPASM domain
LDEITHLISQAEDLGVKSIVLVNNEKDQHPDTLDILKFIREKRIQADSFISAGTFNLVEPVPVHCVKYKFSCYVKNDGMVYPCIGLPLAIGDIRKNSLKKILSDSEIIQNLKNHTFRIKGPCRNCEEFSQCCGCRGRAFLLTKDYLASDPLCPENQDKLDKITHLPMSAENLIPQTKGMRVVSTLLEIGERYAKVESCFSKQSPFLKNDGSLEEIAYMEIMAQSAAVMNGFEKFDTGAPDPGGFLIGGQKINMYMKTYAGQKLHTDIYKVTKFGSFGILSATIKRGEDLIAEGEIKIFENDGADNAV